MNHSMPTIPDIKMNIHINEDKLVIGIIPNRNVFLFGNGTALARIPEKISAIAVAVNIIPIIKDLYLTGANFEIKLNPIGIIKISPADKKKLKTTIQPIWIFPLETTVGSKRDA